VSPPHFIFSEGEVIRLISKQTVDEILARSDIESLIGSYVTLKRAGSNLKGLCPFHNEKSPSFTVYTADNSFYCFGCGIGGNAITFVRQMEHLDYPSAIEFLAKRAGINVVHENEGEYKQKSGLSKERLLKMNVDAAKFFHGMLFSKNPKSQAALRYFTEERGLSIATIKHFGLGFAPDSYDETLKFMKSLGYTEDELVEGFFAVKSSKGRYFDNFRNRVMFPIIDVTGNVIAFGGRVMDDSKPKYRNTMDTVAFKKSRNLFALNFARQSGKDRLILCEGYMDVIAMHAAGFTNAIATLGTAITAEQARLMSRYTKKVVICYDADEAGQKAAQRAMKILSEVDVEVTVIKMPGAKDPDEYIKTYGKDKFSEIVDGSKSKFDYNMEIILSKYDVNLPQDRINALSELVNLVSHIYSTAERSIYIKEISTKLNVEVRAIEADVNRIMKTNLYRMQKEQNEKMRQGAQGFGDRVNPDFAKAPAVASNEENVLGLLLLYPEHRKKVFRDKLLTEEDFFTELNKRVFSFTMREYTEEGREEQDMNELFTPEEIGRITKMKLSRMKLEENGEDVLLECIDMLKDSMRKKNAGEVKTIEALDALINSMKNKN